MKLKPPQDRFTPDVGTVTEDVFCGICCLRMNVERDKRIFRGMAEAMAHHNDPDYQPDACDVFVCPERETDWHYQAHLLYDEISRTNSGLIERMLLKEIETILNTKQPTKRFFNPHTKQYSKE